MLKVPVCFKQMAMPYISSLTCKAQDLLQRCGCPGKGFARAGARFLTAAALGSPGEEAVDAFLPFGHRLGVVRIATAEPKHKESQ